MTNGGPFLSLSSLNSVTVSIDTVIARLTAQLTRAGVTIDDGL